MSKEGEWELEKALQLAGAVLPPSAGPKQHYRTFDMDSSGRMVLLGNDPSRLYLVPLFQSTQSLEHVSLQPPLSPDELSQIESIRVNASGSYVLLQSRQRVRAVQLPPSASTPTTAFAAHLDDGSVQAFTTETAYSSTPPNDQVMQVLGAKGLSTSKKVAAVSKEMGSSSLDQVGYFGGVNHVAWHPLSPHHAMVLTDGDELLLFNVQEDPSTPEQTYALDFDDADANSSSRYRPAATSFCFHPSAFSTKQHQLGLWEIFTCYVLRSDGTIYALCPIVPSGCHIQANVLSSLRSEVSAQLAIQRAKLEEEQAISDLRHTSTTGGALVGVQSKRSTQRPSTSEKTLRASIAKLKSHKFWLQEAWRTTPKGLAKLLPSHETGVSAESWPVAIQGPIDTSDVSVKYDKQRSGVATSLLAMPPGLLGQSPAILPPVLIRSFSSGLVELVLPDAPIQPQWKSEQQSKLGISSKVSGLLLESIDLGLEAQEGTSPTLMRDPADPRLVYVSYASGIHVLNVGWALELCAGKNFSSLPKSPVRHIFSVSPAVDSRVVGASVIKNVDFGHLLVLRLDSGSFDILNISATSSNLLRSVLFGSADEHKSPLGTSTFSRPVKSSPPPSSSAKNELTRLEDVVEDKASALAPRGIRVKGSTKMHEVDDRILEFILERVKALYEDVAYVEELDQILSDRSKLHQEMLQNHKKNATYLQTQVRQLHTNMTKLDEKVAKAQTIQGNLRKRAAAVLQALKENQPRLSRAERQYRSDLERMAVQMRRLQPRISQLQIEALKQTRDTREAKNITTKSPSHLPQEKKRICHDVLKAEEQLIEETKAMVEQLNSNMHQLKA